MWSPGVNFFQAGLFLAIITSALANEEFTESISYTTDAFNDELTKNNQLVMFYAPWCEHCKRLAPTWNELAKTFRRKAEHEVAIAQVNCMVETALCSEHDVTGYPTLKFFKKGETEGLKFRGSRDISSIKSFIFEQLGKTGEDIGESADEAMGKLVEFTEDNFHDIAKSGKHFIKFYAPWCGHCQKMAPTWEELAQSLDEALGVTVGKIDCTVHRSVCNEFEVKGYPTLLWIEDGVKTDKYQGARSMEDFKEYIYKKATSTDKQQTEKPNTEDTTSPVVSFSGDNFESGISSGVSFVKFFAPWCGHCKRLAPTWDELAAKFSDNGDNPEIQIVKIDCTLDENKSLCSSEEVNGFPTIFIYRDGEKVTEYNGSRSLDDLYQFVLKHSVQTEKDEL